MNPIENVIVPLKANIYFDGKVVSHSLLFKDGSKKTLGLIYPGSYTFNTTSAEVMQITAGGCRAKIAGSNEWKNYKETEAFQVPANSSFEIAVENGICEYLCSFE
ncbi:MAG: pyrimidine/purine nucleoside phosphorylase [Deltaproteobacteria bacterium]|nr:pyrimidine/purine nucleoside phosphorylase [Deltaproteobacteria bacterium]